MNPTEGLTIDALTVRYGSTTAVDELTLQVARGGLLALVGPSGCGKSTVLRAVAGLIAPDAGRVLWNGDDLTGVPTHRRDIGLMFQNHALFGHRSVADNVGFGLKMAGVPAADRVRRVDELLDLVGLGGFGGRNVESLSGGEAQRVALARALAPEPKILLLDEPLASLDRARRTELNTELARILHELGQTALYVTHDQHEAFAIADQVGVMDQGRLLRLGTPTEVWRDPRSERVARFVGHETIVDRGGRRFAVRIDAVRLAQAGEASTLAGPVRSCAFQGDRHELVVEIDAGSWRVFSPDPVAPGTVVGLQLDDSRLAPLRQP